MDPRFNSVHLDPTRREEFRRAREALLQARGAATLFAERPSGKSEEVGPGASATFIRKAEGKRPVDPPPDLQFWLVDRDYIYPLKVGVNTMGRSAENDILVEDLYVSRRHCAILVHHDDTCELHDTASKNGTLLNGQKMNGPTILKVGDEIRICNRQFRFMARTAGQAPPVPERAAPGPATHTLAD